MGKDLIKKPNKQSL